MITGTNVRALKQPDIADMETVMRAVRANGGTAIAINTVHLMYLAEGTADISFPPPDWLMNSLLFPDAGQNRRAPINETCDPAHLYMYAKLAKSLGFTRIIWKPLVDCTWLNGVGGWRGWANLAPTLKKRFIADYKKRVLEPYLWVVKELGMDVCFGCEFYLISREHGADIWLEIARWLRVSTRLGLRHRLTYAANWGNIDDPQAEWRVLEALWPALDYIGMDVYFPFESPEDAYWRWIPIVEALQAFKTRMGKELWATEIGWPNTPEAATDPFGNTYPPGPFTTEISAQMWSVAKTQLPPAFDGILSWEAGFESVVAERHNIYGSGLESLVWTP
jgi:hypothetical protein